MMTVQLKPLMMVSWMKMMMRMRMKKMIPLSIILLSSISKQMMTIRK
jgi:hypothetical protein